MPRSTYTQNDQPFALSLPNAQPISPTPFAKNLGFIFDSTLSFSKQISSLSSACHYHIRNLRRIRHTMDYSTASTITTTLYHSRLDYCNSLYHALSATQIKRLQQIQNALARTVTSTSKHSRITPALKLLHWLKIEQRIQFKIVSITHNVLHKSQPGYLRKLIYNKPTGKTRSSDHLCLSLPSLASKLIFSDRSFLNAFPRLWNFLPTNLRSFSQQIATPSSSTPLPFNTLSLSRSQFLSRFKTHLFSLSYPP